MTSKKIRDKFIKFFVGKGHKEIPGASLVPEHDPTVLFTTAGMHPLVPYLLGEKHPAGQRLVNVQKCVRTGDIDEVGDRTHLTFFEMLGYWSLGDYWKKESIQYTFDFFTKELVLDKDKISVTVFAGNKDVLRDTESAEVWEKVVGIPKERIYFLGKEDNFWGPVGETGPCGPCTELFYDTGLPLSGPDCKPSCPCGKYVEIGNNVFMEFNKTKEDKYELLKQKNVDVGLGLERITQVVNGLDEVFLIDSFKPIVEEVKSLSKKEDPKAIRIISDHLKAATFILDDGVVPSNLAQGYVLRRLIRRAIRYGKMIGIEPSTSSLQLHSGQAGQVQNFCSKIADKVIEIFKDTYPTLLKNRVKIMEELEKEEEKFRKTLEGGIKELKKIFNMAIGGVDPENLPRGMVIKNNTIRVDGKMVFHIYETYGLPIEISQEIMTSWGLAFDEETMREAIEAAKKHQELSRKGAEKKFKGGLVAATEETTKLHTATHLLQAALRQILGNHVEQAGSNITPERLRFDFTHPEKMTEEQVKEVEGLVNQKIKEELPVRTEEMTYEEAIESGALAVYSKESYPEKVKVYSIGDPSTGSGSPFSREICGGPHVKNTFELGQFKVVKEEASSAGIRRIKATLL